ncbi:MAG: TlpA family protein disulfide reductase [Thermomicrobiales bacterium]
MTEDGPAQQNVAPPDEPDDDQGRIGYGHYGRATPVALGLLIVAAVVAIGIYQRGGDDESDPVSRRLGEPAPDVTLTLFDGSTLRFADLQGNVVVLNFWAEWCEPCKVEAPILQAFSEQTANEDVVVIGVDIKADQAENARAFIADHNLTYPNARDDGGTNPTRGPIELAFGIPPAYPTTVFLSPDGAVASTHLGPLDAETLREYVAAAR